MALSSKPARHTAETSSLEYHPEADGVGADLLHTLPDLVSGYPAMEAFHVCDFFTSSL
jgi:hypothetical protein